MNTFEQHFFARYIRDNEKLINVFHKHYILIIEDIIVWLFFGLTIPTFLYYSNSFELQMLQLQYIWGYLFLIYGIIIYKLFDWYNDVWIATDVGLIDIDWGLFSENVVYVEYEKIEGIELRTRTFFDAILGVSDVNIRLASGGQFILHAAYKSKEIVHFIQGIQKGGGHHAEKSSHGSKDDALSFEILMETLSEVVKKHMHRRGKDDLTEEYIDKLTVVSHDTGTVDLRSEGDKIWVEDWKKKFIKEQKKHHSDDGEDEEDFHHT